MLHSFLLYRNMAPTVFVVDDNAQRAGTTAATSFFAAIDRAVTGRSPTRVAFDCEGVNLSRAGTLEIVSLCFEDSAYVVYLVDLGNAATQRQQRADALKRLFECASVTRVIHDCRMDCDALYHIHGIQLNNVHDTSCYHRVITGTEDANLNDTLARNRLQVNVARDNQVYRNNPAFWATRPMTSRMITWASSDVEALLVLASKQTLEINANQAERARTLSDTFSSSVWQMKLERSLQCRVPIGLFIGTRGANIRSLQRRSGALIYNYWAPGSGEEWMVFYRDETSLSMVRRAMGS